MTAAERIARNNALFRKANEEIRLKAEDFGSELVRVPFLCECPREECRELVRLPLSEYRQIRAEPNHFMVVPEHEAAEGSFASVVRRADNYVVVEKIGAARKAIEERQA
jgi:hypothetical protein